MFDTFLKTLTRELYSFLRGYSSGKIILSPGVEIQEISESKINLKYKILLLNNGKEKEFEIFELIDESTTSLERIDLRCHGFVKVVNCARIIERHLKTIIESETDLPNEIPIEVDLETILRNKKKRP